MKNLVLSALLLATAGPLQAQDTWRDFAADISPDGKRIVYYSYRGGHPDIFISNIDGSMERQVTNTPDMWDIVPSWSADGLSITFASGPDMGSLKQVRLHLGTGEQKMIQPDSVGGGNIIGPQILSPDETTLAYYKKDPAGWSDLYLRDVASGKDTLLVAHQQENEQFGVPFWSADGSSLMFTRYVGEDSTSNLFLMNVATKHTEQLTTIPSKKHQPKFSTDGQSIVFSADLTGQSMDIWQVDIATKALRQLTAYKDSAEYFPSLTEDGRLFFDKPTDDGGYAVHMKNLNSGTVTQITQRHRQTHQK